MLCNAAVNLLTAEHFRKRTNKSCRFFRAGKPEGHIKLHPRFQGIQLGTAFHNFRLCFRQFFREGCQFGCLRQSVFPFLDPVLELLDRYRGPAFKHGKHGRFDRSISIQHIQGLVGQGNIPVKPLLCLDGIRLLEKIVVFFQSYVRNLNHAAPLQGF